MNRYAIWNKQDAIITPVGEVLTAQQWIDRYPVAGVNSITVVCAAGEINGAFFGTLGQMVQMYEAQGCDFSECVTNEDKLRAIEAFEDAQNAPAEIVEDDTAVRIADALEDLVVLNMPDAE